MGATPPLRDPVGGPRPPWTRGCSTETRPADADGRRSLVQRCAGKVLPGRCWLGRTARCSVPGGSASELQEHFPRPPATLPTPPCGGGVCPSGRASLRLGVSSRACSCVSDAFSVCVSVRDSPLGVIGSLGVSSRLGRSVRALGVGVFERPLRCFCLSVAVCGSLCHHLHVFSGFVCVSFLCVPVCVSCVCVRVFGLCLCFIDPSASACLVPVCACPSLGGCAPLCV